MLSRFRDRAFDDISELGAAADASQRIRDLISALDILGPGPAHRPKGERRQPRGGHRHPSRRYVALYFLPDIDTVFVLALRSQRESDYKRGT
jgi:hypothetical protein